MSSASRQGSPKALSVRCPGKGEREASLSALESSGFSCMVVRSGMHQKLEVKGVVAAALLSASHTRVDRRCHLQPCRVPQHSHILWGCTCTHRGRDITGCPSADRKQKLSLDKENITYRISYTPALLAWDLLYVLNEEKQGKSSCRGSVNKSD